MRSKTYSLSNPLPDGLYFFYFNNQKSVFEIAITSKPIVAHADEGGYELVKFTDHFLGLMTLNAIVAYLKVHRVKSMNRPMNFHPLSEVVFHILEIDHSL